MVIVSKVIVLRKHNQMKEDKLRTHGTDVIQATYNVAAYETVKTEVEEVKATFDVFDAACVAAANGGTTLTQAKNAAKVTFLKALDSLGTALQLTVQEDLAYITNAHYDYRTQPSRSDAPLPDPELDFVLAGVLSGTVDGKVKEFPKGVKAIGIEYSKDGGLNWQNGAYSTGKKFTVASLAVRQDYLIRVLFHGTFQRTSNPSKPIPVFVL